MDRRNKTSRLTRRIGLAAVAGVAVASLSSPATAGGSVPCMAGFCIEDIKSLIDEICDETGLCDPDPPSPGPH